MVIHELTFVSRSIYLSINDATEVLINENLFLNTISRLILGAIYVSKGTLQHDPLRARAFTNCEREGVMEAPSASLHN